MYLRLVSVILLFCVSATLLSCGKKDASDEEILARVGQFEITKTHYLNELRRFYDRSGQAVNLSPDVMQSILDGRVNRYTVVEYAYGKEWHLEPEAQYQKALIQRKVNMEEYERRFIHDNIEITDGTLRELFFRINTSLRASHLYAPNRHSADSLYSLIQSGVSFEDLASKIFQNEELAKSGGDLGFFTVDDMDISFEDMAYRMEIGDISQPVKTSRGYSIIKLTDIITTPVITESQFAGKRHELAVIAREQQAELATREHLNSTVASFDADIQALQTLWDIIQEYPEAYYGFQPEAGMLSLPVPSEMASGVIFSTSDFTFTVTDFLREAHYTPFNRRMLADNFHTFREQVEGMAFRDYALSRVKSHPGYNSLYVERSIEETFFNYLHERFDVYIDAQVEIAEEDMIAEFEVNSEYYFDPLRLNLAEIITTSQERADQAWEQLQRGRDFNTVLLQYTIDPSARSTFGELGFMQVDRFGMLAPYLADIKPGELAGPFQVMSNRFIIFKCLDRIEPRQLSYQESIPLIREVLHSGAKEHLKLHIINEARKTYNAIVYTERLRSIPIQL
jgi:parvulin-like peptidyl-prolyl isomerase